MKTSYRFSAASAALIVAVGALLVTPASAKAMHHSRHSARRHTMTHHGAMSGGSMKSKSSGAAATPTKGMANPAMSTAPATSGGDKP